MVSFGGGDIIYKKKDEKINDFWHPNIHLSNDVLQKERKEI